VYNIVWMLSVVLLIIGVQYCMNVVCSSLDYWCTILYECCLCSSLEHYNIVHLLSRELQRTFIQYWTPIIKRTTKTTFIQYWTPIIKRTTDNIHTILTILYECCLCNSLDNRCTILYECCLCFSLDYRLQYCMKSGELQTIFMQYCTPIIKWTTKTTFIQYCTPIIKRTTDNIHTILYTYNQENNKDNIHTILYTYNQEVQYCMNVVCSSLDYWCTILYECCLCSSLEHRCTILYECCLCNSLDYRCTILYECCLCFSLDYRLQYCMNDTYNQENYRQHSYNIVHLLSGELQTIFMQYCTPIIKWTTKTTFIQYCTLLYECCL
jgi:hypothetical protein